MSWNDKQVELLKELAGERRSARQMAFMISLQGDTVTKNGVIGKMHRMGMHSNGDPLQKRDKAGAQSDDAIRKRIERTPPARPATARKEPPKPPAFRGLTLLELQHRDCRWPAGDPGSFTFCGATRDTSEDPACPYCVYHRGLAFNPVPLRRTA